MFPKRIQIGPLFYDVSSVQDITLDDEEGTGFIDTSLQIIKIKKGIHKEYERLVVCHEVFHGISDIYGVLFAHEDIDTMALALLELIRNNKTLVTYLQEKE